MPTGADWSAQCGGKIARAGCGYWADHHAYGHSGATAPPGAVTEATWERFFHEHEPVEAPVASAVRPHDQAASRSGHIIYRKDL